MSDDTITGLLSEVWVVYSTTDEMGRIGGVVAVATTEAKANELAIGKGWWNSKGTVRKQHAIYFGSNDTVLLLAGIERLALNLDLVGYREREIAKAKDKLLAHMTAEEISLLGIKVDAK
jgi:hypothetical protein